MRRILCVLVGLLWILTGCLRLPGLLDLHGATPGLSGLVRWPAGYDVQATTAEVAQGATVSLIDPSSGNTVATTLTQADGTFSLALPKWAPTAGQPYLLEAIKGLSAGSTPNRAGAAAARLRTLVSKVNGTWTSLTGPTLQVSRGTTALCIVASLKGLTTSQQQALMGKLTPNSGPPETYASTPDLASGDYTSVWTLVNTALTANQDPLRAIARNVVTGSYTRLERGAAVTDLSATSGQTGDTLILYGNGFDPVSGNNQVSFNGNLATSVTVNASGTQLTVVIPDTATTGPLTVKVGNLVMLAAAPFSIRGSTVLTIAGLNTPVSGQAATAWYVSAPLDVAADGSGNVYAIANHQVVRIAADGTYGVFVGTGTGGFSGDGGPATSAKLFYPKGLALDTAGNLYIADTYNHRIRMVPKVSGTYFGVAMTANAIYTIAGNGLGKFAGDGGAATVASLLYPNAVTVDGQGNLFIADGSNNRVRMVPQTGGSYFGQTMTANAIYTIAGNGGAYYGGTAVLATSVSIASVTDLAVDAAGNVLLFAPYDQFSDVDDEGYPYTYTAYCPRIRMVARTTGTNFGVAMTANYLYTIAGNGSAGYSNDGTAATAASFNDACDLALDANGNLLVTDGSNQRLRMVPRTSGTYYGRAMTANAVYTVAGNGTPGFGGDGGTATSGSFNAPRGLCLDAAGNVFVADSGNNRLRLVTKAGGTMFGQTVVANALYSVAGNGTTASTYTGDGGPAANSKLYNPTSVAVDGSGNVFVLDRSYLRVRMIPKLTGTYFGQSMTADGIYTVAGNGTSGTSADGTPATAASLNSPAGIALDAAGNLYLVDSNRVRMVPRASGTYFGRAMAANALYTIAGTGTYGFTGDGGAAISATLGGPGGIALDGTGNLYIADTGNHRVRMVPQTDGSYFGVAMTANAIYTIAGNGDTTFNGNGTLATAAAFGGPANVAVDSAGNLYLSTFYTSYSDVDAEGYSYTVVQDGAAVRMVPRTTGTYFGQTMTANTLYSIAGSSYYYGFMGDGGLATGARFKGPLQIALDLAGNLYIADRDNQRIRMVPRTSGRRYGRAMSANYVYTILGTGTATYNGDGDASTVALNYPTGVAVTASELFVADSSNNLVRKVY